ncbi:MAG: putative hydrolase or acyltransferase of alpha/beta superfamily [Actinomycetia bacterium]|nr:putative hydrolase or acyltransferase of alpha/beta superfamily [Actinomycetes bacterium]
MAEAVHEVDYDEFGMLADNASEVGLPFTAAPPLRRVWVDVGGRQELSAIVWGDGPPEIVLLHGGAQNSHTWDTVLLALGRPALAIDLPGHGHSSWRDDKKYWPAENALTVAKVIEELAPDAKLLVGMSLGGLTAFAISAARPDLVRRLLVVDVTPGVNGSKASQIAAFVAGPERFGSFDEILDRTMTYNPTRSESSLRRGILHNATGDADGSWRWRYDRFESKTAGDGVPDFSTIWDAVSATKMPLHLVVGSLSEVVDADDVAEMRRRRPDAVVTYVEGAGHSIQGDRPLELADILAHELEGS